MSKKTEQPTYSKEQIEEHERREAIAAAHNSKHLKKKDVPEAVTQPAPEDAAPHPIDAPEEKKARDKAARKGRKT